MLYLYYNMLYLYYNMLYLYYNNEIYIEYRQAIQFNTVQIRVPAYLLIYMLTNRVSITPLILNKLYTDGHQLMKPTIFPILYVLYLSLLLLLFWWSPFIPSRYLDEVITYNHMALISHRIHSHVKASMVLTKADHLFIHNYIRSLLTIIVMVRTGLEPASISIYCLFNHSKLYNN